MINYTSVDPSLWKSPSGISQPACAAHLWRTINGKLADFWRLAAPVNASRIGNAAPSDKGHANRPLAVQDEVDRIVARERVGGHRVNVKLPPKDPFRGSAASVKLPAKDPLRGSAASVKLSGAVERPGAGAPRPLPPAKGSYSHAEMLDTTPYLPGIASLRPEYGLEKNSTAQKPIVVSDAADKQGSTSGTDAAVNGKAPGRNEPGNASVRTDRGAKTNSTVPRTNPTAQEPEIAGNRQGSAASGPEIIAVNPDGSATGTEMVANKQDPNTTWPGIASLTPDCGVAGDSTAQEPIIVSDSAGQLPLPAAAPDAAVLDSSAHEPIIVSDSAGQLPPPAAAPDAAVLDSTAQEPIIVSDGAGQLPPPAAAPDAAAPDAAAPDAAVPDAAVPVAAVPVLDAAVPDAAEQGPPPASLEGAPPPATEPYTPPEPEPLPRLVMYHQTIHRDGVLVPIRELVDLPTGLTHLYVAAWHVNGARNVTLNDLPPTHEVNDGFWRDVRAIQRSGVKVLAMLGGAARGSYEQLRLRGDDYLEHYHPMLERYLPLMVLLKHYGFDGIDLDVEEHMTLDDVRRLINRVRADFGSNFLITLAPVFPAMLAPRPLPHAGAANPGIINPEELRGGPVDASVVAAESADDESSLQTTPLCRARGAAVAASRSSRRRNLSGFSYAELEASPEGRQVAWYNVQLYCGWGDAGDAASYDAMVARGWDPRRIVLGTVASAEHGAGYVRPDVLARTLRRHVDVYGDDFGGLMGWEYWHAGHDAGWAPWRWVATMGEAMRKIPPGGLLGFE